MQKKNGFKQSFKTSSYITAGWNWFMMLAGRSAEAVLTISVLYSCARLLPGVNLPVQVDNAVFIAQMVALDVGGLSLGKMAKAAKRAGNPEGATLAGRVSIALITIMVSNVVLSVLQTIIPGMPGQLVAVVEAILLIARAVMAVCYAHVIHSLKGEHGDESGNGQSGMDDWQMVGLSAYLMQTTQQVVAGAISEASANVNQILTSITEEQSNIQATLHQLQTAPATVPTVDNQAIIQVVLTELLPQFQAKFQAVDQAIFRQNATITEVANQAKKLPENATATQQFQAAPKQQFQAKPTTLRATQLPEQNILRLVPANASRDELKAEAIRLHEDEGMSSYKIAEKLGKSAKTVQSWLSKDKDQAESEEIEAAN